MQPIENRARRTVQLSLLLCLAVLGLGSGRAHGQEASGDKPNLESRLSSLTKGESLSLEARAFITYWFMVQDEAMEGEGDSEVYRNSFELTRMYFGAKAKLVDWLSARFTADVGPEKKGIKTSAAGSDEHRHEVNGDQSYQLFVKFAWLEARLAKNLALRAGVIDIPYNSFTDELWGYRFVSKNLGDEEKLWHSADLGAYLRYALPGAHGQVALGATNGAGYKSALDGDAAKDVWAFVNLRPLAATNGFGRDLVLAGYANRGLDVFSHDPQRTVLSATLGYDNRNFAVAYQFVADGQETDGGDVEWGIGHAGYLRLGLPAKWSILGRFVMLDSDKESSGDPTKYQVLAGIGWAPIPLFQMALSTSVDWRGDEPDTEKTEPEAKIHVSSELLF